MRIKKNQGEQQVKSTSKMQSTSPMIPRMAQAWGEEEAGCGDEVAKRKNSKEEKCVLGFF